MGYPLRLLIVFLLYALSGWMGLKLATYGNAVTLIWPPTGVAMFALLGWGLRLWPAIWLAAFTVNIAIAGLPLFAALLIATGNVVGPLLGAWALRRLRFSPGFTGTRDILLYVGIGALGVGLLTASNGTSILALAGIVPVESFTKVWLTWWMGDAAGALVVGSALLSLLGARAEWQRLVGKSKEAIVAWACMLITLLAVSPLRPEGLDTSPLFTFPFVIWLALRIGMLSGTWAVLLVAAVATWSATAGIPPFAEPTGQIHAARLWSLMVTLGTASLLVVAMRNEGIKSLQSVLKSEKRLRRIIDVSPVSFALHDENQRLTYLNPSFVKTFGYTLEDIPTLLEWRQRAYPDPLYRQRVLDDWRERLRRMAMNADAAEAMELTIRCKDGSDRTVLADTTALEDSTYGAQLISLFDITERQAAEERARLLAGVFQYSGEAIMVTDRDNRIIEINAAFSRLTGYAPVEVLGRNPHLLSSGRTTAEQSRELWETLKRDDSWKGELWDRHKDGHVYPVMVSISTIRDKAGAVAQYIASYTDITERKISEERISFLAHHDVLTQLPNRLSLQARLEQALAGAHRDGSQIAVLLIDLDNFKSINDTLGHNIGDALLIEVARRLRESVRDSDIVARLGGDEFVVVLTEIGSGAVSVLAGKLLQSLGLPYSIEGYDLHSTPSIGISIYPDDSASVEGLIKSADVAMYHAKSNGRNNFQFFTQAMNASATERLMLENSLRRGLERQEFLLHYQPQIDVASGRVVGIEALVRWQHPELGMIPPDRFIPVAEETGLILLLGAWVLEQAVAQLSAWEMVAATGLRMAVNLSARQLRDPGLLPLIEATLARYDVSPQQLELEITESVAMENPERTSALLLRIRAMGVGLAIDDFGTGYSGLAQLHAMPIDTLKIDASFTARLNTEDGRRIVQAIVQMAHALKLDTIVEGVEEKDDVRYLVSLDVTHMQGRHFGEPMPAGVIDMLLAQQSAEMA